MIKEDLKIGNKHLGPPPCSIMIVLVGYAYTTPSRSTLVVSPRASKPASERWCVAGCKMTRPAPNELDN